MVKINVNGKEYETNKKYIMDALDEIGIHVPRLCKHKDLENSGKCRLCVVEVNGKLVTSCNTEVMDNMNIITDSHRVVSARVMNLKLLLSNHPSDCLHCFASDYCELQELSKKFSVHTLFEGKKRHNESDFSSFAITREHDKCVVCGRCIEVCDKIGVHALDYAKRGFETIVKPGYDLNIVESGCISCGQCALYCPTGAIHERDNRLDVIKALSEKDKVVVAQIAPAIRVSLAEEFSALPGTRITKQIVTALKLLGFDYVFDTSDGADLTIMEEAYEFVERFKQGMPLFTSCCPAWVQYVEIHKPEWIQYLSTTKSPHMMLGSMLKSYFASRLGIDSKKMVVVSIMPCTAKKEEAKRVEMKNDGLSNVDIVLTTKELAMLLKEYGINPLTLPETNFDSLNDASSAGQIFGRSGGVMEAALRTAAYYLGFNLAKLEFESLRGMQEVKVSTLEFDGKQIKVAVVNGLKNLKLLNLMEYNFVEVMTCPGGCIAGGGQPKPTSIDKVKSRMNGLNVIDEVSAIRESHKNKTVLKIYEEFLNKPGSELAHKYLHTKFFRKDKLYVR